jgi:hypothetical protein
MIVLYYSVPCILSCMTILLCVLHLCCVVTLQCSLRPKLYDCITLHLNILHCVQCTLHPMLCSRITATGRVCLIVAMSWLLLMCAHISRSCHSKHTLSSALCVWCSIITLGNDHTSHRTQFYLWPSLFWNVLQCTLDTIIQPTLYNIPESETDILCMSSGIPHLQTQCAWCPMVDWIPRWSWQPAEAQHFSFSLLLEIIIIIILVGTVFPL